MTKPSDLKRRFEKEPDDPGVTLPPQTAIAKYEMAAEDYVEGTQDLTREDLQIPQITLVQATSKKVPDANKHGGEFYNNLTGEFRETINAVLLAESKGRVCFDRTFDGDSDPLCGSDDSISPRAEYFGAQIHDSKLNIDAVISDNTCAECPFSKFGEDGTPPMCAKSYTYGMLDAETMLPFVISAQRSSMQAGKQLNTIAKTLGRRKYINISSRYVSNDKGNYYVLGFTTNGDTEPELKQYAFKYSLEAGNISKRAQLAAPVNADFKKVESGEIPF